MEARSVAAVARAASPPQPGETEDARLLRPPATQDRRQGRLLVRSVGVAALVLAALAFSAWFSSQRGLRGHKRMEVAGTVFYTQEEKTGNSGFIAHQGQQATNASNAGSNGSTTLPPVSPAPLFQFYIYRANSAKAKHYEFGNINVANVDGVVWYLLNEVVTMYSDGPQCPRKFNISQINRYKVRTRATKELFETSVNFGVRYSYDFGQCMGRCLPDNMCTGSGDCDFHFDKFGFNAGCNKFTDEYPFPTADSHMPGGVWYSLPLEGRCDGVPTGAKDCTWSYEEAGVVSLEEVEAMQPWGDNCCPADRCSGFWDNQFDEGTNSWRVQLIQDKFQEKYPNLPRDLWPAPCDFWKESWYTSETDVWEPRDPWAAVDEQHGNQSVD